MAPGCRLAQPRNPLIGEGHEPFRRHITLQSCAAANPFVTGIRRRLRSRYSSAAWSRRRVCAAVTDIHPQKVQGIVVLHPSPDLANQLAVREDFARVLDEQAQQIIFDRGQLHGAVMNAHLPVFPVDRKRARDENRARLLHVGAAKSRPNPGQQLARAERLGQVIVGSCIESCDLVGLSGTALLRQPAERGCAIS